MAIPLSYTPVDHNALNETLRRFKSQPHMDIVREFERNIAEYIPGCYPVAVQSGTSAIHLALKALGVTHNDYVIVPTFTYIGTVNPVLYEGAIPVFVDCENATWNIDNVVLRGAIRDLISKNKKPRAIIIVHTYGMPGDIISIRKISAEFEIPVIEDAAEAIGSTYNGTPVGNLFDIGILSFNNNKILTTYGGGAVLCKTPETAAKVLFWASQSREPLPYYLHRETGFNYRMGCLAAAMGIAQWPALSQLVTRRREILQNYTTHLSPRGWETQAELWGTTNAWLSVLKFPTEISDGRKNQIFKKFAEQQIEVRPLWNPLHTNPLFQGCMFYGENVAKHLFENGICLPSSNNTATHDQERVLKLLDDA